uniref:Uncharacterized protein n=1 Tax=Oryza sativa subsp. japonica TaxID=39947 RepID=Q6ETW5_ORYSJ|nr:hypothetical protein [Oryza sativa Japonica Group]
MDLIAVSLPLFLVDCRIKSTDTLAYPKASFGPALELSRSPSPRVFHQHKATKMLTGLGSGSSSNKKNINTNTTGTCSDMLTYGCRPLLATSCAPLPSSSHHRRRCGEGERKGREI